MAAAALRTLPLLGGSYEIWSVPDYRADFVRALGWRLCCLPHRRFFHSHSADSSGHFDHRALFHFRQEHLEKVAIQIPVADLGHLRRTPVVSRMPYILRNAK